MDSLNEENDRILLRHVDLVAHTATSKIWPLRPPEQARHKLGLLPNQACLFILLCDCET